jgi:hypothetical protein
VLLAKDRETTARLAAANAVIAELRDQVESSEEGRTNKIYELTRAATIASDLNKEHANALGIAAKKIIRLEEGVKLYKHTVKDVARTLGSCLNGLVTAPVTKDDLEAMHAAAVDATPDAPDAVFTLRIAEKVGAVLERLDRELQLALNDVTPHLREQLKKIPAFEDIIFRHARAAAAVHSDVYRLVSSVDEACRNFEHEFASIQPDEI